MILVHRIVRDAAASVGLRCAFRAAVAAVVVLGAACGGREAAGQAPGRDPRVNVNVMLVKNALAAVNHANLTGNYTVLRDLGSPSFRERNPASKLAEVFGRLREQRTDLSPILVMDPQFTEPPTINDAGHLQMAGYFPSQPLQVHFRLVFQMVAGGWAIETLAVGTPTARPAGGPNEATNAAAGLHPGWSPPTSYAQQGAPGGR